MRAILNSGLIFVAGFIFSLSLTARADIQTVNHVDVPKYLGDWYQISHIPLWFEGNTDCACARQRLGTTATAGTISVVNTCTQSNGSLYTIAGTASDDDASNAKFTVTFQGVAFKGTYWIIGLDAKYRYAVVTDQGGDALYILSKTPTLNKDLYNEAVAIAQQQIDTSKLKVTNQVNCTYPN